MTDEKDSGLTVGTTSPPNEAGSQGKGDSASSFDAAKLQSTIEALSHKLEEVDARSRALQGEKDRGVNKATKEIEDLKAKIAEYEKLKSKGFDLDEAVDEINLKSTIRRIEEQLGRLNPASQQATGTSPEGVSEAAKVFEKAQVDPNLAESIALLREYGNDPVELAIRVGQLKQNLGQSTTAPTSAPSISVGAPQPADIKALTDKYLKDMLAARGNKELARQIKEEAKKKGVPVDRVAFSV